MDERGTVQIALRIGALGFVVCWLLVRALQEAIPFWLPFAILLVAEVEFLARGWRERRWGGVAPTSTELSARRRPGEADADLGWGEIVEGEDGPVLLPPPPRPPRTRRRRIVTVLGVAVAAALFIAAARVDRDRSWSALSSERRAAAEALFSREAGRIAGAPVTVRCDDGYAYTGIGSDALGVAFVRSRLALLDPTICRRLVAIVFDDDRRERDDSARAVLVLAHEAVHLGGERDEGVTECKGLQEGVARGERLGLERAAAQRMMGTLYLRNLGERSITRLSYALPDGCVDGGSLDLRPDDGAFP